MQIIPSTVKGKRYTAVFSNGRRISFGQPGATTFADGAPPAKRAAYIARHRPNEDWNNPYTAGALSRWLLWEEPGIEKALEAFRERFPAA